MVHIQRFRSYNGFTLHFPISAFHVYTLRTSLDIPYSKPYNKVSIIVRFIKTVTCNCYMRQKEEIAYYERISKKNKDIIVKTQFILEE